MSSPDGSAGRQTREHKVRLARLLRGERNVGDLDRLFTDLRFAKPGRPSVTDVGNFAAHRDERDKGIVFSRAADIQTSARSWARQMLGIKPTIEDMLSVGTANLTIATDEQLRERLGMSRDGARSLLNQGLARMAAGSSVSNKQREVIRRLGLGFSWQFAFDDNQLASDLADVLVATGALEESEREAFDRCRPFITLHALTLMHGSRLRLPDGAPAPLGMTVMNEGGTLRIKAAILADTTRKPVHCVVSVFETSLIAKEHCSPDLLPSPGPDDVIEIGPGGLLRAIR